MKFVKRLFESRENNFLRKLLLLDNRRLKKGYYTVEVEFTFSSSRRCEIKFELMDRQRKMELHFSEVCDPTKFSEIYVSIYENEEIKIERIGQPLRIKKEILIQLLDKFENALLEYQKNQEIRYSQFVKELVEGNYDVKEKIIDSEGIEEAKEIVLSTNQGINLIFNRESKDLLIKVRDSSQLYLRSLEYSMEEETFVNAKVRKLNISPEEKEGLLEFVKKFIKSKNIEMLFTEEEKILSKINVGC